MYCPSVLLVLRIPVFLSNGYWPIILARSVLHSCLLLAFYKYFRSWIDFRSWIVKKGLMEDHGSRNIDVEALENSLKAKLCGDSPLSAKCCIFRVPELFRRHKPEAYQPDIVSIGPFHGSGELSEPMKKVKLWYLNTLLLRKCVSLKSLIQGIDKITGFEKRARDYYAESLDHLNHKDFVEMMIIDGCFLLALFRRSSYVYPDSDTVDDPLSNMSCMYQYLCHDLLLLENQLPWFVLESLHSLICNNQVPLTTLVLNFFGRLSSMSDYCEAYTNHTHDEEILHILDLIRSANVVPFRKFESSAESKYALPHATALLEAGIEFRRSSVDGLMNIDFKDGVLTIPQLAIAEMTEPLFRNLIAFEQCCHGRMHQVGSYALLMDNLISSSKDVVFLCDKQIIYNWFSAEEVSQFFSKLHTDTFIIGFCYGGLCAEVNKYYEARWNKWLARLKRDHLSNPWKITSLVAAFILLVLTLLQTTYTLQQYYHPR